jgi:hypothetical protein
MMTAAAAGRWFFSGLALLALAAGSSPPAPLLEEARHPGEPAAIRLTLEGMEAFRGGDFERAAERFAEAVRLDPTLAAAWINLSASAAELCHPDSALVGAMMGRLLAPDEPKAAENLRTASGLSCPAGRDPFVQPAERRAAEAPTDSGEQVAAAAARRQAGHRLVAALYEEQALAAGADPAAVLPRLAEDLAAEGLLESAVAALGRAGSAAARERAAELRARHEANAAAAERLGRRIAARAGLEGSDQVSLATEIAAVLLARGIEPAQAERRLAEALGVGQPRRLQRPWGSVRLDAEWSPVGAEQQGLLLVARRFPGDTQVVLAGWDDPGAPEARQRQVSSLLVRTAAAALDGWTPCATDRPDLGCQQAPFEVTLRGGTVTALDVFLLGPADGPPRLLALGLPGAAGCGPACREQARAELRALVETITVSGVAPPALEAPFDLPVPPSWTGPGPHGERDAPWRTHPAGGGLVIDVPPGIVAGRVEGTFRDRHCGPRTALWLRGAFVDEEGHEVVIGDADWAGYLDLLQGPAVPDDAAAVPPPRTDPEASMQRSASLAAALEAAGSSHAGTVGVFAGGEFPGRWLVYRLQLGGGPEAVLALPVREGGASLSLHWMPTTLRAAEAEGPPGPVDLAEARDIVFKRVPANASRVDPREGTLIAGPIRVAVPRGFRVSMNAYSADGYPVVLRGEEGARITLERLPAGRAGSLQERERQTETLLDLEAPLDWRYERGGQARVAVADVASEERERRLLLAVPRSHGEQPAFRLTLERGEQLDDEEWEALRQLVTKTFHARYGR